MVVARRPRAIARRKLIWARTVDFDLSVAAGAANRIDLLATFRLANGGAMPIGATVTRIRLSMIVGVTDGLAFNSSCLMGAIVDQLYADATKVPVPLTDAHADWMYWQRLFPVAGPGSSSDQDSAGPVTSGYEADVRSQRKAEELGQTLWLVTQHSNAVGATINIRGSASVLLKLP